MKIIKRGKIPIYTGTCNHCDSIMEAEREELRNEPCGYNDYYLRGECMLCHRDAAFELKTKPENT